MKNLIAFAVLAAAVNAASAASIDVFGLNSIGAGDVRVAEIKGLQESFPAMTDKGKGAYKSVDLSASSRVRSGAEETDSEWADENIMNGVAHVRAARFVFDGGISSDRLAATAAEYAKAYFKYYDEQNLAAPVKTETGLAMKPALDLAALNIAKGFFYDISNQENIRPLRAKIAGLVRLLGASSEVAVLSAKSKAVIEGTSEDALEVGLVIFLNIRTGDYLAFYSREGNG